MTNKFLIRLFSFHHLALTRLILINVFVFLVMMATGQGKFIGNADELNRKTKLKKLPTMSVWDKKGNKHDLADYINKNQLNEGKPIMLATFGTFGNYSIDELNDVANSSIPDEYNVIVLCVGNMKAMTGTGITEDGYEKNWPKFMVAKMLWDDLKLFYKESWPFSVFTDKDRNILYYSDGWIKPVKEVKLLLNQIQSKKIIYGKYWYTKKAEFVDKDDPDAYYYVEVKAEGNKIREKQGTKTKTLMETNYIYKDNGYYYDGIFKASTEEGQETFTGEFKEAVPVTTVKAWHSNGKIKFSLPLNGTAKAFDNDGQLTMEGPMQNGLGNGNFTNYEKGVKTAEYSYKNGNIEGLIKEFKEGELVKEYLIKPEYESYGELKSGLQNVKIKGLWGYVDRNGKQVIAPQYESTLYNFEEGVASVELNGKWINIDQNGKIITESESTEIKKNWKYDVKVYKTKTEVLRFLQQNFVPKLYNERFKNDTRIESLDPTLKFEIPLVAGDYDIPYSKIVSITAKQYDLRWYIELVGEIVEEGESFLKTDHTLALDYSVSKSLANQIAANLRQLAILNGAKLIMEDMKNLSSSELFEQVNKAVNAAIGYSAENKKITAAGFSKDKCMVIFDDSGDKKSETRTGMDWSRLRDFHYEKKKNLSVTDISLWFSESAKFTEVNQSNSKWNTHFFHIYVPDDQLLKTIAALHLLKESFAK